VYISDVESNTVEEALQITYSQSKRLLQEYGLDFRFLLDELLIDNSKDKTLTPLTFDFKTISRERDLPRIATRSPSTPSSSIRSRTPQPGVSGAPPLPPLMSPQPRRALSPEAPSPQSRMTTQTPTNDQSRPPRSAKSSPAPPPRSSNRPGSVAAQQRPPAANLRREGMF